MSTFLIISGVFFDGVILEGAFNSARQNIPVHPFIWVNLSLLIFCSFPSYCWCIICNLPIFYLFPVLKYYWKPPGLGYFMREPWAKNKVVFPTEEK